MFNDIHNFYDKVNSLKNETLRPEEKSKLSNKMMDLLIQLSQRKVRALKELRAVQRELILIDLAENELSEANNIAAEYNLYRG